VGRSRSASFYRHVLRSAADVAIGLLRGQPVKPVTAAATNSAPLANASASLRERAVGGLGPAIVGVRRS
jgi:hypothetical protein